MKEKKRFLGGGHIGILALVLIFLCAGHCVLANQHAGPPEEAWRAAADLSALAATERGWTYLSDESELWIKPGHAGRGLVIQVQ